MVTGLEIVERKIVHKPISFFIPKRYFYTNQIKLNHCFVGNIPHHCQIVGVTVYKGKLYFATIVHTSTNNELEQALTSVYIGDLIPEKNLSLLKEKNIKIYEEFSKMGFRRPEWTSYLGPAGNMGLYKTNHTFLGRNGELRYEYAERVAGSISINQLLNLKNMKLRNNNLTDDCKMEVLNYLIFLNKKDDLYLRIIDENNKLIFVNKGIYMLNEYRTDFDWLNILEQLKDEDSLINLLENNFNAGDIYKEVYPNQKLLDLSSFYMNNHIDRKSEFFSNNFNDYNNNNQISE